MEIILLHDFLAFEACERVSWSPPVICGGQIIWFTSPSAAAGVPQGPVSAERSAGS